MVTTLMSRFRERNDLKIDDLVHFVAEVVPQVAGPQLRYKVTSIPDARTVRYYIQEGLVDPPLGAAGPAALYGYRHLLQLVLVKVLQGHYLPIRQIRQTIEKLTDRELEKLLEGRRSKTPTLPARPPTEAVAEPPRNEIPPAPAAERLLAQSFLRSIPLNSVSQNAEPPPARFMADSAQLGGPLDSGQGWARHELFPGIELHVHDGVVIPSGSSFPSVLASRMRVILEKLTLEKSALEKRSKS